jgi:hypothetical protein
MNDIEISGITVKALNRDLAFRQMKLMESEKRSKEIIECLQMWCLGINLADGINVDAMITRQGKGDWYVELGRDYEDDFNCHIYAKIEIMGAMEIAIKIYGECFKINHPNQIKNIEQFDYNIVTEGNRHRRINNWDLCIYVLSPEEVVKVMATIEPYLDWED